MGGIAHEVFHFVNRFAEYKGIGLDYRNDESLAYLLGYIVDESVKFIRKKGFSI